MNLTDRGFNIEQARRESRSAQKWSELSRRLIHEMGISECLQVRLDFYHSFGVTDQRSGAVDIDYDKLLDALGLKGEAEFRRVCLGRHATRKRPRPKKKK